MRDGRARWIALLESGRLRLLAFGPSTIRPFMSTVSVIVDTGDRSLEAVVARIDQELTLDVPADSREEVAIDLPIGAGRRVVTDLTPPGGSPTRYIRYTFLLRDGISLTVAGTSFAEDPEFGDLMAAMVSSLSRP